MAGTLPGTRAPQPPTPLPVQPMLDGYAAGRLLLPTCEDCGTAHLYPRAHCPACNSTRIAWREASGRGVVLSFSVVYRAPSAEFAADVPYTVAIIRLAEGPQMMSRVVDLAPEAVRIGLPVRVRFAAVPGGTQMPVFAPDPEVGT